MYNVRYDKRTRNEVYHHNNKPQEKTSQSILHRQHRNIRLTLIGMPNTMINSSCQYQKKLVGQYAHSI